MKTYKRVTTSIAGLALLALLLGVWPQVAFAQGDNDEPFVQDVNTPEDETVSVPQNSWEAFSLITTRNVFSKDRRERQVEVVRPPVVVVPPEPETFYVLRGIVREDGTLSTYSAYLENTQGGGSWVHEGDEVCRGKITSLTFDQLVYERTDPNATGPVTVIIGQDLQGALIAAGRGRPRTSRPATQQRPSRNDPRQQSRQGGTNIQDMLQQGGMDFGGAFGGARGGRTSRGGRGGQETTMTAPVLTPPPNVDPAEVLRQLIERRQQELSGN